MIRTTLRLASLAAMALSLQASVLTNFSDSASFGGNDTLQWGVLADEGNTPASPFNRISVMGLTASTTLPGGFLILVEGSAYSGNFASGNVLLNTNFANGPISITFGTAIRGIGTQMQRNNYGAFNGVIRAYDSTNALMGTFVNTLGLSNGNGDNSAIFVGVRSDLVDILRVEFEVTNNVASITDGFSLNFLRLDTTPGVAIPEPATLGLVGGTLCLLAWKRRRL